MPYEINISLNMNFKCNMQYKLGERIIYLKYLNMNIDIQLIKSSGKNRCPKSSKNKNSVFYKDLN